MVPARSLSDDCYQAWASVVVKNPEFASPFFHPEFTRLVSSVVEGAFVSIFDCEGEAVGFFPFQRGRSTRLGYPLGMGLAGHQGVVAPTDLSWTPRHLLRASGLAVWRFTKVPAWQEWCSPYVSSISQSPFIDVTAGFADYARRLEARSDVLRRLRRLARKMERDVGPLHFEVTTADIQVLQTLFSWKSNQYRRTGVEDVLAQSWVRSILEAASKSTRARLRRTRFDSLQRRSTCGRALGHSIRNCLALLVPRLRSRCCPLFARLIASHPNGAVCPVTWTQDDRSRTRQRGLQAAADVR